MDYQIYPPVKLERYVYANGVHVNQEGAWLGEIDGTAVALYSDEGDYIPAPEDWRDLVVSEL